MKILNFKVSNAEMFENEELFISLENRNRISLNTESFYSTFKNINLPKVVGLLGNNASGKTTVLNALTISLNLFFLDFKLDDYIDELKKLIGKHQEIIIEFTFLNQKDVNEIIRISASLKYELDKNEFSIQNEYFKNMLVESKTKKEDIKKFLKSEINIPDNVINFDNDKIIKPKKLLIFNFLPKFNSIYFENSLLFTNFNMLSTRVNSFPNAWLEILDPSIEKIEIVEIKENNSLLYNIIFKNGKKNETTSSGISEVLSSGTIKVCGILTQVQKILNNGGYFVIDELENHLNIVIVKLILELFEDSRTNPLNATLIFSTHYIELLDSFDRMDNVFITSKKENKINIDNLRDLVDRTDLKKSDIYYSTINEVGLKYENIKKFKKYFMENHD